ncbi:MAG TPA: FIST N-terminal domain-containing protein, partial [Polyangiaceae bacterium]|nr:FIST N-terminal domain-containing protein [Polyangiaceae bacterium]
MKAASSFALRAESPARFARACVDAIGGVERPAGAVLLLSGALGQSIREVAAAFDRAPPGVPLLLAAGAGVLTDKGEIEGQSAGAGLVWSGGEAAAFTLASDEGSDLGAELGKALASRAERASATALVFAEPGSITARALSLLAVPEQLTLFGAGTSADSPIVAVAPDGRTSSGAVGAIVLRGPYRSIVRSSAACRLLMPLRRVSQIRGSMILEIEGEPALDVLKSVTADLQNQPLVFVALATEQASNASERPELLIRGVQGVDPGRAGVMVSDELRVGMLLAFAVRDATAARADLENVARELARETAGAAPKFGFYVN